MLASLVRALFRASSAQSTKGVDGDMAGNHTMTVTDHEVDRQDAPAGQIRTQNIPEDFVCQCEILKANIDVLGIEINILFSTRQTCFPPLAYLQLIVHGSHCRPRKKKPS